MRKKKNSLVATRGILRLLFRTMNLSLWAFGGYTFITKFVVGLPAVQRWGLNLMWKGFWSAWF